MSLAGLALTSAWGRWDEGEKKTIYGEVAIRAVCITVQEMPGDT